VLQRLDLTEPDLGGLDLLLDHEGVGLDRALGAGSAEEVLESIQHGD
jgi:hypothetical protein